MSDPLNKNIFWTEGKVLSEERAHRTGYSGCVVWLTGLSASGKSTDCHRTGTGVVQPGQTGLCPGRRQYPPRALFRPCFSPEDRRENIRCVREVVRLFADAGMICITAFISPYRSDRDEARRRMPSGRFIEVYLNVPLEVCEQRDPKGLYARALAGEIKEFTGVSAPYEPPLKLELELHTDKLTVAECVSAILVQLDTLSKVNAAGIQE